MNPSEARGPAPVFPPYTSFASTTSARDRGAPAAPREGLEPRVPGGAAAVVLERVGPQDVGRQVHRPGKHEVHGGLLDEDLQQLQGPGLQGR